MTPLATPPPRPPSTTATSSLLGDSTLVPAASLSGGDSSTTARSTSLLEQQQKSSGPSSTAIISVAVIVVLVVIIFAAAAIVVWRFGSRSKKKRSRSDPYQQKKQDKARRKARNSDQQDEFSRSDDFDNETDHSDEIGGGGEDDSDGPYSVPADEEEHSEPAARVRFPGKSNRSMSGSGGPMPQTGVKYHDLSITIPADSEEEETYQSGYERRTTTDQQQPPLISPTHQHPHWQVGGASPTGPVPLSGLTSNAERRSSDVEAMEGMIYSATPSSVGGVTPISGRGGGGGSCGGTGVGTRRLQLPTGIEDEDNGGLEVIQMSQLPPELRANLYGATMDYAPVGEQEQPGHRAIPDNDHFSFVESALPTPSMSRRGTAGSTGAGGLMTLRSGMSAKLHLLNDHFTHDVEHQQMERLIEIIEQIREGKFSLMDLTLGKGAYGKVQKVLLHDGHAIAVKQISLTSGELDISDPSCRKRIEARFERVLKEIKVLFSIKHPNVLQIYHCELRRETMEALIFMELVSGGSLGALVKSMVTKMPEDVVIVYVRQIVSALVALHGKGICHRDLKGDNILRTNDGQIKLGDFGTAKLTQRQTEHGTVKSGLKSVVGTAYYMAPEVLVGTETSPDQYDAKVDVWSLGITVCELLDRGRLPWPKFDTRGQVFLHIAKPGTVPKWPQHISPEALSFVTMCCKRDPVERPTAEELLQHQWLKGGPTTR